MKTRRILIVEDDEFSRGVMEKLLQSSGHEIESCVHGKEAVRCLTEKYFDILITDLQMPEMDGFELIHRAKVIQPELKTILVTGFVSEEIKEKTKAGKIDGLFHKPIAWGKLLAFINILSDSKKVKNHHYLKDAQKQKRIPFLNGIFLILSFILFFFVNIQLTEAQEPLNVQYRPSFRSDVRRDCSKSLSSLLSAEQLIALKDLQNSFYAETAPIRRDLIISNVEFRQLVSDPRVDPKILLDRQSKILELQSKLERLSLSYQIKARSIFTSEQLDRLPWDCMLGMGTEFGINVGVGRAPRKGYRR